MTTVILLRHGETIYNTEMRFQGIQDSNLTEKGLKQAELLAKRLMLEKIDHIYSSDILRAKKTATIIAEKVGLKVQEECMLREMDFGDWEGLKFSEISSRWPQDAAKIFSLPSLTNIPNGESFFDVYARAFRVITKLVSDNEGKTIVLVSHGCFIRMAICSLLAIPLDSIWSFEQKNTAYNKLFFKKGEKPLLAVYNDTKHLD